VSDVESLYNLKFRVAQKQPPCRKGVSSLYLSLTNWSPQCVISAPTVPWAASGRQNIN